MADFSMFFASFWMVLKSDKQVNGGGRLTMC
jgi:hypothetical protein